MSTRVSRQLRVLVQCEDSSTTCSYSPPTSSSNRPMNHARQTHRADRPLSFRTRLTYLSKYAQCTPYNLRCAGRYNVTGPQTINNSTVQLSPSGTVSNKKHHSRDLYSYSDTVKYPLTPHMPHALAQALARLPKPVQCSAGTAQSQRARPFIHSFLPFVRSFRTTHHLHDNSKS